MESLERSTIENKVAWITGSSRGIGKAIAEHFAAKGAKVIIHGSRMDSAKVFGEGENLKSSAAELVLAVISAARGSTPTWQASLKGTMPLIFHRWTSRLS